MSKVIDFPGKQNQRLRREQRKNAQQAILSLSMVSLIMGALLLNDSIQKRSSTYLVSDNSQAEDFQNLNRAIASAHPMNPFRDLEWERKLALRLSQEGQLDSRNPASISKKVDSIEQLRYGILEGKYIIHEAQTADGLKISEISYKDSDDVSATPVLLEPSQFLKEYKDALAIKFSSFDRANHLSQQAVQEFRLLGGSKEVLGLVSFTMDDQGHLISVKVKPGLN